MSFIQEENQQQQYHQAWQNNISCTVDIIDDFFLQLWKSDVLIT